MEHKDKFLAGMNQVIGSKVAATSMATASSSSTIDKDFPLLQSSIKKGKELPETSGEQKEMNHSWCSLFNTDHE